VLRHRPAVRPVATPPDALVGARSWMDSAGSGTTGEPAARSLKTEQWEPDAPLQPGERRPIRTAPRKERTLGRDTARLQRWPSNQ